MDFETFINKYSFVNSKFVKDFYNIIKEDYIERYNEFLIDSEILRKWLEIKNKQIFNDTIKRSYKKNIDYKIDKMFPLRFWPGVRPRNLQAYLQDKGNPAKNYVFKKALKECDVFVYIFRSFYLHFFELLVLITI